jgi:hypothetical protein
MPPAPASLSSPALSHTALSSPSNAFRACATYNNQSSRSPQAGDSVLPAQRLVKGKCHLTRSFFLRRSLCVYLYTLLGGHAMIGHRLVVCLNNTNLCLCPDNSVKNANVGPCAGTRALAPRKPDDV